MVRTDSSDPAGRLHAYLYKKPQNHLEMNSSLTAVRQDAQIVHAYKRVNCSFFFNCCTVQTYLEEMAGLVLTFLYLASLLQSISYYVELLWRIPAFSEMLLVSTLPQEILIGAHMDFAAKERCSEFLFFSFPPPSFILVF